MQALGRLTLLMGLAVCGVTPVAAQLINLRTVPVAAGDQFLIFPSDNLGLGGIGIALDDPWLDPFVNPAKGARVTTPQVFVAPTFYSIGQNAGSAATLSAGTLFGGRVFGGALLALQQLKSGQEFFGPEPLWDLAIVPPDALSAQSATNKFAFFSLGTTLPGRAAIGASATFADLNGIDGVEHLYAMSSAIDQSGSLADVRLGLTKEFGTGGLAEGLLLYDRFSATHDVYYVDWVVVDSTTWTWERQERLETNKDRTDTWGLHLGFRRPVGEHGWRVGGILTGNYKSHPTIPNYELVNIPRDPGHSTALDIGVGVAKQAGALTMGLDLVYEPAWSSTWAEAAQATPTTAGDTIPAGGKTVENEFQFSNAHVNVGAGYEVGVAMFQLGLQVRAYDYHLDQWDNVERATRRQNEEWMEWAPSWGVRLRLKGVELRYQGRVTTGTGLPGVAWNGNVATRAESAGLANDIVVPPGGPLTLAEADVWTHQVSVAVPIR
jgi:hypothetical protein